MLFDLVLVTTIAFLPNVALTNAIAGPLRHAENRSLQLETRTLFPRAPSDYPLAPGPFPNEFKYENWDTTDDTQRKDLKKIHDAFGDWRQMAEQALAKAKSNDLTVIHHWYGDKEPVGELIGVFKNMWNVDTGQAATPVSEMVCDRTDFRNFCTEFTNAYTDATTGRFHICRRGLDKPLNSGIECTDVDNSCSKKMRTLPMVLLHEMTHYDNIGLAAHGISIVDDASGAYDCFTLSPEEKSDNAQNYAWFAGEAYWGWTCGKTFENPKPGVQ